MRVYLLVAVSMFVIGCGSGTTNPSSNGNATGNGSTLTASIDGAAWNQSDVTARYSDANPPYLEVTSLDKNNNLLGFLVRRFGSNTGDLAPGTYEIGATNSNANYITAGGSPSWTAAPGVAGIASKGSGTIVLTSFSKAAKTAVGTFSFVLAGSISNKTVTNGVFSVKWN